MTTALLAALGAIVVAAIGALSARVAQLLRRVERLEEGPRLMWAHNRHLRDLYYRWRRDGAPDPDPLPDID